LRFSNEVRLKNPKKNVETVVAVMEQYVRGQTMRFI
jgi:hypothetical protein